MNSRILSITTIGVVAASLAMAGCSKSDQNAAKSTVEGTVAQVDQKARQIGEEAKDATKKVGDKLDDSVITASVKTEIAKDAELSALKVNVDTDNGRVALHGTAPSMAAKEHATTLAAAVKGVASVDNQLSIEPAKK
jgi:hyperosmotically inducible periplasmic protein